MTRDLFDELAGELCAADPALTRATMMGFPCLRVHGTFAAGVDHRSGALLVKLPQERVTELVEAAEGRPFAPAGRTFREWVSIPDLDERRWRELLAEAVRFAAR